MNTTRSQGCSRRRVTVAALAVGALPLGLATAASATASTTSRAAIATSSAVTSSAVTTAPRAVAAPGTSTLRTATSAPARTGAPTPYAAVIASGTRRTLVLVSRTTGKVLRTLGSERVGTGGEPFVDVDLAADGTVWAVVQKTARWSPYAITLRHYTSKRVVNVLPYVTSVRESADARQLAVTVLSPDGNHDGKGTQSLRIVTPSGKLVRNLSSLSFPVDARGWPQVEVGGLRVSGWLNRAQLVVGDGCCDSAVSAVVPALKPSRYGNWPAKAGDGSTRAIGIINSKTFLVGSNHVSGTGQANDPLRITGVDAFTVTASRPSGRLVASIRKPDIELIDYVDTLVARAKAVPWVISAKRFPYSGTGRVLRAFL